MSKYVIKTQCKEARAYNGNILTAEGEEVWIVEEPEGWVEATSSKVSLYKNIPKDAKVFKSEGGDAKKFIKKWEGHPWYHVTNGKYEIIEVVKKWKKVFDGWEQE